LCWPIFKKGWAPLPSIPPADVDVFIQIIIPIAPTINRPGIAVARAMMRVLFDGSLSFSLPPTFVVVERWGVVVSCLFVEIDRIVVVVGVLVVEALLVLVITVENVVLIASVVRVDVNVGDKVVEDVSFKKMDRSIAF
jgi:hypothetical protein